MFFGWFSKKKEVKDVKEETKKGFELVKKDISAITGWIKHLDSEKEIQKRDIIDIKETLSNIQEELEGIKNVIALENQVNFGRVFKTSTDSRLKQISVYPVQHPVQTDVQTLNLNNFSITERAIIWILINTDLKLSYEDLAAMMKKEKSTIRGQINSIRQKNPEVIEEKIEKNGKKRIFIPEEIREKLLKKSKVRVNLGKNTQKGGKISKND